MAKRWAVDLLLLLSAVLVSGPVSCPENLTSSFHLLSVPVTKEQMELIDIHYCFLWKGCYQESWTALGNCGICSSFSTLERFFNIYASFTTLHCRFSLYILHAYLRFSLLARCLPFCELVPF